MGGTDPAPHLSCPQHTTIPDNRLRAPVSMTNAKLCLDGSISSFCALSFASLVQVDGIYPSPRTLLLPSFPGTSNRNTNAPFIYLISKSSTRSVVLAGCLFPPSCSPIPQNNAPCDLLPRTEPPRLGFRFSVFSLNPPLPRAPFNQMAPRTQPWLTPPPMCPLYLHTTFSAVRLWELSLYGLVFSFFWLKSPLPRPPFN